MFITLKTAAAATVVTLSIVIFNIVKPYHKLFGPIMTKEECDFLSKCKG